ncbi:hypothetical protein ES705_46944 [subsurface metagenome]
METAKIINDAGGLVVQIPAKPKFIRCTWNITECDFCGKNKKQNSLALFADSFSFSFIFLPQPVSPSWPQNDGIFFPFGVPEGYVLYHRLP